MKRNTILASLLTIVASACGEGPSPASLSVSEVRLGMSVADAANIIKAKYDNVFQGEYPVFSSPINSRNSQIGENVYLMVASSGEITGIPYGTPSSDFELVSVLFSSRLQNDQSVVAIYKIRGYSNGIDLDEADSEFKEKYSNPTQFISRFGGYISHCFAWSKDGDLLRYQDQIVESASYTQLPKECRHLYVSTAVPTQEERGSSTIFNLSSQPSEAEVIFFTEITSRTIATSLIDVSWAKQDSRFFIPIDPGPGRPEFN